MAASCDYVVNCYINATQHFYHLSKLYTGLIQLERQGSIELRLVRCKPTAMLADDPPWTPWLEIINNASGERRTAVVDLSDHSAFFYGDALQHCDIYFKRNLEDSRVAQLPEPQRGKVHPFGLNYGCKTQGQFSLILPQLVSQGVLRWVLSRWAESPHLKKRMTALREFLSVLPFEEYERPPDGPMERVVHFQARVFTPSGGPGDEEEWINTPGVELIRALRKALGKRFWGGLVPDEFARRRYPDLISVLLPKRRDYIALGKRALVGIASEPCVKTFSFKLGELLAASRCIVSAPVSNKLPAPLVGGEHYLEYRNPDECVSRCVELLDDYSRADAMRHKNWEYYQEQVAPAAHILLLLRKPFG